MTNILADSVSAQTTDQKPESWLTNLVKTFVFSVVVVLVCAVVWGLVGYFTNTVYFWAAIVIGLLVSLAAMSTGSPRSASAVGIESARVFPAEISCRLERSSSL